MSDSSTFRWGILGAGSIAHTFAKGVAVLDDATVAAVGARDLDRAQAFADTYGIPKAYGGYDALVNDPDIDAIYVCTTHNFHAEHCLLALRAGKPVLCEKPFTINERELQGIVDEARSRNLFLMEAMWTRCFPLMAKLRDAINSGRLGDIRIVTADFGFQAEFNPASRLHDLKLGGGALLDVGIYPLSFASMLLGEPVDVAGFANLSPTGADQEAVMSLRYKSGALANLLTATTVDTPYIAYVVGTKGKATLHHSWWKPTKITVSIDGAEDEVWEEEIIGSGFEHEAAEAARCIRAGLTESPIMTLDDSLALMRTMDRFRALWGVKYPMDN
jgi:predicted dehydrogenase